MELNCWEVLKCGREAGGDFAYEGVCPAAVFKEADGFNDGINAGRGCLFVANTYCYHNIQRSYKEKIAQCKNCGFYKRLQVENRTTLSIEAFELYVKS